MSAPVPVGGLAVVVGGLAVVVGLAGRLEPALVNVGHGHDAGSAARGWSPPVAGCRGAPSRSTASPTPSCPLAGREATEGLRGAMPDGDCWEFVDGALLIHRSSAATPERTCRCSS